MTGLVTFEGRPLIPYVTFWHERELYRAGGHLNHVWCTLCQEHYVWGGNPPMRPYQWAFKHRCVSGQVVADECVRPFR